MTAIYEKPPVNTVVNEEILRQSIEIRNEMACLTIPTFFFNIVSKALARIIRQERDIEGIKKNWERRIQMIPVYRWYYIEEIAGILPETF